MIFSDGGKYCNRCGYTVSSTPSNNKEEVITIDIKDLPTTDYRGIPAFVWETLGVKMEMSGTSRGEVSAVYYPIMDNGCTSVLGYKVRTLPKKFSVVGSTKGLKKAFFGQQSVAESGKFLIIVEGEDDTAATRYILSLFNKRYNVVGISFGANSAEQLARDNINWLSRFESIVIIPDQDEVGRNAAEAIAKLLPRQSVKIATLSEKDVCDLMAAGKEDELLDALYRAKTYTPRGIIAAADFKQMFMETPARESFSFPPVFNDIGKSLDGLGRGEVMLVTGGTGGGKSQFCDQLAAHWLSQRLKVGILKMEHSNTLNVQNLLSVIIGVNLKKPELKAAISKEQLEQYYEDAFVNSGQSLLYIVDNAFDDADDEGFLDKFRELALSVQCDVIIIDHLHAILYEESDANENTRVDTILRMLVKLAKQANVGVVIVAHPRKSASGTKSPESGGMITLDSLKGSSGLKQQPDIVISLIRDTTAETPELQSHTTIYILKNRYHGVLTNREVSYDQSTSNYIEVKQVTGEY